jgi:hypothetical protein
MNFAPFQYVSKFCRRRPWLSATVFTILFLLLVPTWPYTPFCRPSPGDRVKIKGKMSADFRHSLKAHFRSFDVYYWDVGGVILVRALPFLDGGSDFWYDEAYLNANNKAATSLTSKTHINSYVGHGLNSRIYRVPDFIEALRNPKTGRFDRGMCNFMVPVVTGKPIQ